jgi:hypothetical protein
MPTAQIRVSNADTTFAGYVGAYFVLGDRLGTSGAQVSIIQSGSAAVTAAFVPLAMIEANIRQRDVVMWSESERQVDCWVCYPLHLPFKVTVPLPSHRKSHR